MEKVKTNKKLLLLRLKVNKKSGYEEHKHLNPESKLTIDEWYKKQQDIIKNL